MMMAIFMGGFGALGRASMCDMIVRSGVSGRGWEASWFVGEIE